MSKLRERISIMWPILLAGVILLLWMLTNRDRPPVVIEEAALDQASICGSQVAYHARVRFRDAPITMISVRTIWDVERQQTHIWANAGRYAVFTEPLIIERDLTYEIPERLSPGKYELRISYQTFTSHPAVVALPFVVPGGCP